jgi:hypothetical protein
MEIESDLAQQAFAEAYRKYPRFETYAPKLVARKLFQGSAFMLEYTQPPPGNDPDAWEFQNLVVKTYKRLAGV